MYKSMVTGLNTIALDLGTTTVKAAVCDEKSQIQQVLSSPAPTIHVEQGRYFSDALAYLAVTEQLLNQCLKICLPKPLLGLCYQRSSFVIWDSRSGVPVTELISWQDNSGQSSCDELINFKPIIKQLSGLPLTPYFFAPKLRTLFQQRPELLTGIVDKTLCVGTLDSFIIWHWSAGKHYLTDVSMASRTLLMAIGTGQWSKQLAELFTIPVAGLAEIRASVNLNIKLANGAVLQVSVADQSSALLASVTLTEKTETEILVNLGTGGFVIRAEPKQLNNKMNAYLRTLVYQTHQKKAVMAIEGTINSITAALQAYPYQACKAENLAEFPAIFCSAEPTGIGAPFFRPEVGIMFSQPVEHLSKMQIACCLLEGIVFRVALILDDFIESPDKTKVYLSGGLADLSCLQQGIANCSVAPVFKLVQKHASLQGTAILINNLPAASYRQSAAIELIKHQALFEKYQQWKSWFRGII